MNLQLPAERKLAEPERMVDRIITQAEASGQPTRRVRFSRVAIAAAVAIGATAVGVSMVQQNGRVQVVAPPTSGQTSSPSPAHPANPSARRGGGHAVGTTVRLPAVSITVGTASTVAAEEYAIYIKTCVHALPRDTPGGRPWLGVDSWTLTTSAGVVTTKDRIGTPVPLPTTYPQAGSYELGKCAFGYIPFGIHRGATVQTITFRNEIGDLATWSPDR